MTYCYSENLFDLAGIHEKGRKGNGTIFIFPAGNGKNHDDTCACDGYVNSIYTMVISAVNYDGSFTHYSERCAAIIATVYAGNSRNKLSYNIVRSI